MNIKRAWMVFFGALVLAVPARICELTLFVDYDTGYFTDKGVLAGILAGFLMLCSAIIIFMCHMDKNSPKRYPPVKNIPLGVLSGAAGVMAVVHSIFEIVNAGKPRYTDLSDHTAQMASKLAGGQMILTILISILGVLAGIIWLVTAADYFRGKNGFRDHPAFSLLPPLWMCITLVGLIINTAYTDMTENIYDMLTVMFLLLFLFMQAKMFAGVQFRRSGKEIYAFGFPAVLFAAINGVPNIVLQASGVRNLSSLSLTFSIVHCILAAYIILYLIVVRRIPDVSVPEPIPEELEEAPEEVSQASGDGETASQDQGDETKEKEADGASQPQGESHGGMEGDASPPVKKRKWNEPEEEEPDVEEIIDIPKVPAIYKFKAPPKPKRKKKKKKKKKKFSLFQLIRRMFDMPKTPEEEEEENKITWHPGTLDETESKKLDNNWLIDYYGFDRKDGEPYVPSVQESGEPTAEEPLSPEEDPEPTQPDREETRDEKD